MFNLLYFKLLEDLLFILISVNFIIILIEFLSSLFDFLLDKIQFVKHRLPIQYCFIIIKQYFFINFLEFHITELFRISSFILLKIILF